MWIQVVIGFITKVSKYFLQQKIINKRKITIINVLIPIKTLSFPCEHFSFFWIPEFYLYHKIRILKQLWKSIFIFEKQKDKKLNLT